MKALVQLSVEVNRDERRNGRAPGANVQVTAVWMDGVDVIGEMAAGQLLAMLEEARMQVLSRVPMVPPQRPMIEVASALPKGAN